MGTGMVEGRTRLPVPGRGQRPRGEVDKMLAYAHLLGITDRKLQPEEMFHPTTLDT